MAKFSVEGGVGLLDLGIFFDLVKANDRQLLLFLLALALYYMRDQALKFYNHQEQSDKEEKAWLRKQVEAYRESALEELGMLRRELKGETDELEGSNHTEGSDGRDVPRGPLRRPRWEPDRERAKPKGGDPA